MKQKLNAKDFILIGVLTALMWIICMIIERGIYHLCRHSSHSVPAGGRFLVHPHRSGHWRCHLRLLGYGTQRNHDEIYDGSVCAVQCYFCFQRHLPHQVPSKCLCRCDGEEQYCPGVHRRDAEYHFCSNAGSHCRCWAGRWSDWRFYRPESVEETLYQGWTRFSKITGSAP